MKTVKKSTWLYAALMLALAVWSVVDGDWVAAVFDAVMGTVLVLALVKLQWSEPKPAPVSYADRVGGGYEPIETPIDEENA